MPRSNLLQWRHLYAANVLGIRAARVESTTGRRIHRAWHIAAKDNAVTLFSRVSNRHSRQQRYGVMVLRRFEQAALVRQFNDYANVHHRISVTDILNHLQISLYKKIN